MAARQALRRRRAHRPPIHAATTAAAAKAARAVWAPGPVGSVTSRAVNSPAGWEGPGSSAPLVPRAAAAVMLPLQLWFAAEVSDGGGSGGDGDGSSSDEGWNNTRGEGAVVPPALCGFRSVLDYADTVAASRSFSK